MLRPTLLTACLLLSTVACAKDVLPIHLETSKGAVVYTVGEQSGDASKLLETLRKTAVPNQEALDRTIAVVIASKQVKVADLQEVRALLQKYGFLEIRFFTYWEDKQRMSEVSFGNKALPFTLDAGDLKKRLED